MCEPASRKKTKSAAYTANVYLEYDLLVVSALTEQVFELLALNGWIRKNKHAAMLLNTTLYPEGLGFLLYCDSCNGASGFINTTYKRCRYVDCKNVRMCDNCAWHKKVYRKVLEEEETRTRHWGLSFCSKCNNLYCADCAQLYSKEYEWCPTCPFPCGRQKLYFLTSCRDCSSRYANQQTYKYPSKRDIDF